MSDEMFVINLLTQAEIFALIIGAVYANIRLTRLEKQSGAGALDAEQK
jgi:hypothetical protein